jgi:CheY-like chemotaxis protein/anti-sigma regulatory factor (Ser/Thr protein kinase)
MTNALSLLRRESAAPAVREKALGILDRQLRHVVRLIDDLLDVSRITSGKVELQKQRVEVGAVVAKAIELASPLLEAREQQLALSVLPHGLAVDADPARLAQIISNLLTNAAKYSHPRSTIFVSASREREEIVVRVRDQGVGIAPEMLERIFDSFVQERQSIDRSQGGLGLGLAIVRSLVSLHGGRVAVHSDGRGRGSEFSIALPAARLHAEAAAPAIEHATPRTAVPPGHRVLVVDDNADGALLLCDALTALGHCTRSAHDGPAALRAATDFRPDVALLDIGLPAMDGYELAQRIRRDPALRGTRLIAVTGYGQESDRERARRAGFDAHVVKPVDIGRLEELVRQLGHDRRH